MTNSDNDEAGRKRVTITLDPKIHEMGKELANADRRDFSRCLECLIEVAWKRLQEAKQNGHHKEKAA